jgi:hypothetical protein
MNAITRVKDDPVTKITAQAAPLDRALAFVQRYREHFKAADRVLAFRIWEQPDDAKRNTLAEALQRLPSNEDIAAQLDALKPTLIKRATVEQLGIIAAAMNEPYNTKGTTASCAASRINAFATVALRCREHADAGESEGSDPLDAKPVAISKELAAAAMLIVWDTCKFSPTPAEFRNACLQAREDALRYWHELHKLKACREKLEAAMRPAPQLPPPPSRQDGELRRFEAAVAAEQRRDNEKASAEYAKRKTVGEFGRTPFHIRAARGEI